MRCEDKRMESKESDTGGKERRRRGGKRVGKVSGSDVKRQEKEWEEEKEVVCKKFHSTFRQ